MRDEDNKKAAVIKLQRDAYTEALQLMQTMTDHVSKDTDYYKISVAAEEAEGMYMVTDTGALEWKIPEPQYNQHLEVVVQDKEDGRFIPNLAIHLRLYDDHENFLEEKEQMFLWHPFLYHYGANWEIPKEGMYTAEVLIQQPQFGRHDEIHGKRYLGDVTVKLGPLKLHPGRKEHGPE